MNDQELIKLLRSGDQGTRKGWRCPDENLLAAYVHKQLSEGTRSKLDAHFVDCKACLETLALIVKTEEMPPEQVPAPLLVRARSLAESRPGFAWRWRWALATVTACALIAVLLGIWRARTSNQVPSTELVAMKTESTPLPVSSPQVMPSAATPLPVSQKAKSAEMHAPVLRGGNDPLKLLVMFPRNGASVDSEQQPIRWKPVADASFYEVTIVTPDGGHIMTKSTSATEFSLQGQRLQAGEKYFVRVIAHLSSNRIISSDLVGFYVNAKP